VRDIVTHETALVRHSLLERPRVRLHVAPTSGSLIALVECRFSPLRRRALAREIASHGRCHPWRVDRAGTGVWRRSAGAARLDIVRSGMQVPAH
jgi:hypothetical protein